MTQQDLDYAVLPSYKSDPTVAVEEYLSIIYSDFSETW
jgi:hypothetical protein